MATEATGESSTGTCPACKNENVTLHNIRGLFICEKCSSKRFSNKVRKGIQEAYERQEEKKRRDAWKKRIEVARRAVRLYDEGLMAESLKTFREYLGILETRYQTGPSGLHPSLFEAEKNLGEILLVAGVYWDMAKIYDHTKGRTAELRIALSKFLEFSIERPHMILASEAIRKYIQSGEAQHVSDFKNSLNLIHQHLAKCFIATAAMGGLTKEIESLQKFRDTVLVKSRLGRLFIWVYYSISPPIARFILKTPRIRAVIRKLIKNLLSASSK